MPLSPGQQTAIRNVLMRFYQATSKEMLLHHLSRFLSMGVGPIDTWTDMQLLSRLKSVARETLGQTSEVEIARLIVAEVDTLRIQEADFKALMRELEMDVPRSFDPNAMPVMPEHLTQKERKERTRYVVRCKLREWEAKQRAAGRPIH
jgi:hypothetical protein